MRKINEIFYSLQGEGRHTGVASVFVRFSGCNLRCPFCDTKHQNGRMMSDEEIAEAVNRYPAQWIILTGGEPSLRIDEAFVTFLHTATDKKIAIETNGTNVLPSDIDWVTFSPKIGISGAVELPIRIEHADEIKVVDIGQNLEPYFNLACRKTETLMYLQPCFVNDTEQYRHNIQRTVKRVLSDPRWVLSAQMHRFLDIP